MSILQNKYNIEIWQGSTFGLTITVKHANNTPKNITSDSARMQVRSSYDNNTAAETMSTSNGEITITDGANGVLHVQLSAERTANLTVDLSTIVPVRISETEVVRIPRKVYVYDLELFSANGVTKILHGDANVYGEVTR